MPLIACASVRTPHAAVSRSQAGSGRGLAVAASASHTPAPSRESGRNSGLRASAGLANSGMCGSRPCGSGACGSGACGSGLCCSGLGASAGTAQPSGLNNVVPALHIGFVIRHQAVLRANSGAAPSCSIRGLTLYAAALEYARSEQYEVARRVFAKAVEECPGYLKPWVSWAQVRGLCEPLAESGRRRQLPAAKLCARVRAVVTVRKYLAPPKPPLPPPTPETLHLHHICPCRWRSGASQKATTAAGRRAARCCTAG